MAVKVVTDSTADLPPEVVHRLGITVIPLNVHFGTQTYLDGVDLKADDFYHRLPTTTPLPTTSQPSIGKFLEIYRPMVEAREEVIAVHISSKLSGTYNSALQARQELGDEARVVVIDTFQASIGLGLIVMQAARVASQGASLEQVTETVRQAMDRVHFFGVLDTLEYLMKGGRIGKAQGFLGSLLQIKPLLTMRDGEAHPLERTRSQSRAVARMVELAHELAPVEQLGVLYSTTPEEATSLAKRLSSLTSAEVVVGQIGPVVGTYLGPGALAIGVLQSGHG